MEYKDIKEAKLSFQDTNDCSVVAMSVVASIPYAAAHQLCKDHGRQKGKGFTCYSALRSIGFTVDPITKHITSKTIRTIERELAAKWGGVMVLIRTTAHILGWDGYKIVDWSTGRAHRIIEVLLIYKGDRPTGKSVPMPKQQSKKVTARPAAAVMVNGIRYPSMPAAYKALALTAKGRQKARRIMKSWGTVTTQCYPVGDPWYPVWITFTKAE